MEVAARVRTPGTGGASSALPALDKLPLVMQVLLDNIAKAAPHERPGIRDRLQDYVTTFTQRDIAAPDGDALNAHLAHHGLAPIQVPTSATQTSFALMLEKEMRVRTSYSSHTGRDEPIGSDTLAARHRFLSGLAHTVKSLGDSMTPKELSDAASILTLGLKNLR